AQRAAHELPRVLIGNCQQLLAIRTVHVHDLFPRTRDVFTMLTHRRIFLPQRMAHEPATSARTARTTRLRNLFSSPGFNGRPRHHRITTSWRELMLRTVLAASLLLLGGVARAEDIKGQVRGVDPTKSTITIMVGEEDKTFDVAKDAKITVPPPRKKKGQ